MDLTQLFEWRDLTTAMFIGAGGYVANWMRKVNAGLNDTVKSAAILHERLDGHEKLDETRYKALDQRVDDLANWRYDRH